MGVAKVLISIDDELLQRIDARAQQLGLTRSAYVARVVGGDVTHPAEHARRRRAIARGRELFANATPIIAGDTTDFVRRMRDER